MKFLVLIFLAVIFSSELYAQSSTPKAGFGDISFGLGIAEAIRFTPDEHNRDHDLRFLVNLNLTKKIYHPFYLRIGLEYNKKDLDGYSSSLNIFVLPSLSGNAFNNKVTYFTEIGPNIVAIYYPSKSIIQFSPGLTIGLRVQYYITEKYAVGVDIRHINYFNIWSEHYFIIHSNLFFAVRI